MSLRIYNTLTRAIEPFVTVEPGQVRMYVCGMTIYDLCHIGHARMMMAFDVVQRWLRSSGLQVRYVRNITDIDDKIIKRALERGISIRQLTDEMLQAMYADTDALGIERPSVEPRATEYVPQMLSLISQLKARGLAYQVPGGDVNYSVRKFVGYGKLSGKSLDELRAGERVAVLDGKEDPLDFVLWKSAKPGEPEDAKWDSDAMGYGFGVGRPGWHIECSAMSCHTLGETFDIHGGGADLQFPHHENEIAQSEGASGQPLARWWMHNGFVRVDNEKMSKSLGNFFTIRAVLAEYDAETVRFFLLRTHYRSALNYSDAHLNDARKVEYIVDLALHFDNGALHVKSWEDMPDEEIIAELVAIRGIGRWTAEMFLIFHMMRPNVLPLDDVGLINGISQNYFSGDTVSRSDAREVAVAWAPYCSVATWYIWRSLDPLPVAY